MLRYYTCKQIAHFRTNGVYVLSLFAIFGLCNIRINTFCISGIVPNARQNEY